MISPTGCPVEDHQMSLAPCLASTLLLLAPAPATSVYFEQTTVALQQGRPAGPGVATRVWYAGQRMRMESADGGEALILRLDQGKAFRIDPVERRVLEMRLDQLRARSQMDLSMAGDLMGIQESRPRTVVLRQTKTIAGYPCRGYRVTAGTTVMDLYVSSKVPLGISAFTDFLEWSGANDSMGGLLDAFKALPGFPLETRTRVTVMDKVHETVSTVTAVKVGPQPDALFEPPAGYRVEREEP
jgi:uncharacterized protein DUF4412